MKTLLILLTLLTLSGCKNMLRHERRYQEDKLVRRHMAQIEGDKTNLEIYGDAYVKDNAHRLAMEMGDRYVAEVCKLLQVVAGSTGGTGLLAFLLHKLRSRKKDLLITELKKNGNGGKT